MTSLRPILIFVSLAFAALCIKTCVSPPHDLTNRPAVTKIPRDESMVRDVYDRYHQALLERDIKKLRRLHTKRSSKETATKSPEWDFKPFKLDQVPSKYRIDTINISDYVVHIEAEGVTDEPGITYNGRIYMELEEGILKVRSCDWERFRNGTNF